MNNEQWNHSCDDWIKLNNDAVTSGWLWVASMQLSFSALKLLEGVKTEEGLTSSHRCRVRGWPLILPLQLKQNKSAHLEVQLQTHSHAHKEWGPEVSRESRCAPGLEDVGAHAPVLSLLRLPVTSLVHKALLSSERVPPLVKPQWLVALVFPACEAKHRCYANCGHVHHRTHTWRQFAKRSGLQVSIWEASNSVYCFKIKTRGQSWNKA